MPEAGRVSRKPFLVREIGRHLLYDSVTEMDEEVRCATPLRYFA